MIKTDINFLMKIHSNSISELSAFTQKLNRRLLKEPIRYNLYQGLSDYYLKSEGNKQDFWDYCTICDALSLYNFTKGYTIYRMGLPTCYNFKAIGKQGSIEVDLLTINYFLGKDVQLLIDIESEVLNTIGNGDYFELWCNVIHNMNELFAYLGYTPDTYKDDLYKIWSHYKKTTMGNDYIVDKKVVSFLLVDNFEMADILNVS